MSIALQNQLTELERRVEQLEKLVQLLAERRTLSLPKKSDAKVN